MTTWIALLRGINVGGNNILPMKDLRALCETIGFENVRTYIQSGNCVFRSARPDPDGIAQELSAEIERRFSFRPPVLVMKADDLSAFIADNPYPEGDPKTVQLFFLFEPAPGADLDGLNALRSRSERFTLADRVLYLHAPDGIGRSKLVEKIGKHVPVSMTARNLRTALKLQELAQGN